MDLHSEMPKKIDFTEKFPDLFSAVKGEAALVRVPKFTYITSSGVGHPTIEGSTFEEVKQFLGGLAFSMKFRLKRIGHEEFKDYKMPPMECFWTNCGKNKEKRKWKLQLMQPSSITEQILRKSVEVAKMKKQEEVLPAVKFESYKQGLCIQTLHVGAYDEINETIEFLIKEANKQGYKITGDHHEIYLNDTRRTQVHKLQTIVRYQLELK